VRQVTEADGLGGTYTWITLQRPAQNLLEGSLGLKVSSDRQPHIQVGDDPLSAEYPYIGLPWKIETALATADGGCIHYRLDKQTTTLV